MIKKLLGAGIALGLMASTATAQSVLTAETGPAGTVPFTALTTLAEIASAEGIANFQVADGQTLTNSLQNVAEGKTDVSSAPLILTFLMSRGAGPYANLGAEAGADLISNVQVLHTFNYGGFGLYAYDSTGLSGWDDVAGKTILNGPPRGAALTNDRQILQFVTGFEDGKDYTGLQVNWGQMPKTISDGSADAMMLPITFPDARITRSLAAGNMTLWSVPKDIWESEGMQKYIKSPGTAGVVFDLADVAPQEGLTIVSEDGIWRSPTTVGAEVVNKSMDFDTAKALTAAIIANTDTFLNKTPFMATTNIGVVGFGMCGAVPVKYHPGAVAAYEEAGTPVPDCAKP
ncbi:TAXI family TRAP transporter solute-binding subunit [Algirhabdus cladophorae]|uniref:TAXI family TRAP transporter solute-binding subunit n=1 Tax=Algirhabdus cladophorae TaxID=3377108 RepID=UPI003B8483B9